MAGERLRRILDELSAGDDRPPPAARLCEVGAQVIGITGAGVMLMSGETPRWIVVLDEPGEQPDRGVAVHPG